MGKPPSFKVSEGPYHFSPGPAAYSLRQPTDVLDKLYASQNFGRSRSNSKSPKRNLDKSFESYQKGYKYTNLETLKKSFNPSNTQSNFIFKESGPRFGSSSRAPLDVRETIQFPGPGSYFIKDKLLYPKCKDVSFGSNSRAAEFLETGSISPGPARYKQKPLIGKDLTRLALDKPLKHKLAKTFGKRNNSVFAVSGHKNILQY